MLHLRPASTIQRLAILLALLTPAPAAYAAAIPFTAQLALTIAQLGPVVLNGSGTATVNGSGGGFHISSLQLPAGAVQTTAAPLPVTDPAAYPVVGLQITAANAVGNFSGSGGIMPLPGVAKVCLFGSLGCAGAVSNLSIPLSVVGQPAAGFVTGVVNLTVFGAAWTTQTAAFGTFLSAMGFRHGPASATSSTAAPSGQLQLVTPINISTNLAASNVIPSLAVLTLHFVPEPGTMLLIGGGLSLLAVVGRRRVLAQRG